MQDRVIRFVTANSHVSEEKLRALMFQTGELARDIGTVLVGQEAVECGLIDAVGGIDQAVASLQQMIQANKIPAAELAATAGQMPLTQGMAHAPHGGVV